jgi:uncharacterized delta-60 repeat protein
MSQTTRNPSFDSTGRDGAAYQVGGVTVIDDSRRVIAADLDVNGVDYTWPGANGAAGTVLTNNGSGGLSWSPAAGGGFVDVGITATEASPYTVTAADAGKRLVVNSTTPAQIQIQDTGSVPVGTQVQVAAFGARALVYDRVALDSAFVPPTITGSSQQVQNATVQQDGKVLICGSFTAVGGTTRNNIARLNADGTLDSTFDPNMNGQVMAVVLQPDGKILAGGYFSTVGGVTQNGLARLNTDGTRDTGFTSAVAAADISAVALLPDGKILVGYYEANAVTGRMSMARLHPDGTFDASFNAEITGSGSPEVQSISLMPDGRIVIAGNFATVSGQTRAHVARVHADGRVDRSFVPAAPNSSYHYATVQQDGRVILYGNFTEVGGTARNRIARLNSDGTLDTGWDAALTGTSVNHVRVQPTGKLILGGIFTAVGGTARTNLARLHSSGALDTGWSGLDLTGGCFRVVQIPDGSVLVMGLLTAVGGTSRNRLARLNVTSDAIRSPRPDPRAIPQYGVVTLEKRASAEWIVTTNNL